uniref:CCHC-type domain-containing protein n=1 Tax=Globodera pallida TaxID=36090 RepID=A0A183CIL2_GLOPA
MDKESEGAPTNGKSGGDGCVRSIQEDATAVSETNTDVAGAAATKEKVNIRGDGPKRGSTNSCGGVGVPLSDLIKNKAPLPKPVPQYGGRFETCWACGGAGHKARDCSRGGGVFPRCFNCGRRANHMAAQCPYRHPRTIGTSGGCWNCGDGSHRANKCDKALWCLTHEEWHNNCGDELQARHRRLFMREDAGHQERQRGQNNRRRCWTCGDEGHLWRQCPGRDSRGNAHVEAFQEPLITNTKQMNDDSSPHIVGVKEWSMCKQSIKELLAPNFTTYYVLNFYHKMEMPEFGLSALSPKELFWHEIEGNVSARHSDNVLVHQWTGTEDAQFWPGLMCGMDKPVVITLECAEEEAQIKIMFSCGTKHSAFIFNLCPFKQDAYLVFFVPYQKFRDGHLSLLSPLHFLLEFIGRMRSSTAIGGHQQPDDVNACCVCQSVTEVVFLPCGHSSFCLKCSKKAKDPRCPVCRLNTPNKPKVGSVVT